jgi:hypothetical protein
MASKATIARSIKMNVHRIHASPLTSLVALIANTVFSPTPALAFLVSKGRTVPTMWTNVRPRRVKMAANALKVIIPTHASANLDG